MRHINYVRERFRKVPTVRITWADWGLAHVEAFYSRGDRGLAPLIYEAYKRGAICESHGEFFSYKTWQAIWETTGYDQERVFGDRRLDEVFPWDYIHAGTTKGYLKHEYKQMFKADSAPVPDCKWGDCQKCGIPGNYLDISLAGEPVKHKAPSREPQAIAALAAERRAKYSGRYPYRIEFSKTGLSRFIAHQNTLDLFEKAFRRLKLPLAMSSGFNPRPVMRNTGALPLGLETRRELLVIELRAPAVLDETALCAALTEALPEGMRVTAFKPAPSLRVPRVTSITYRTGDWREPAAFAAAAGRFAAGALNVKVPVREREVLLADWVDAVWIEEGELFVRIKAHDSGAGLNPYLVYGHLLQTDGEALRHKPIAKADFAAVETSVSQLQMQSPQAAPSQQPSAASHLSPANPS